MAIQKTITLKNNFGEDSTFVDAYVKVAEVGGSKARVSYTVEICKEKDGRVLQSESFAFVPNVANNSQNFIAQAYAALKTEEKYAGAIDV